MVWTRAEIHYATGFDNGDLFQSEAQVRAYFTVENMRDMFGECPYTQEELDEMAEEVIRHRWHMALSSDDPDEKDIQPPKLEEIAMNQEIRVLAGEALSYFEYRKRHDGTKYWALEEGSPEWVRELVWAAHNKREILPEDFRYLFIVEALEAIAENPEEPESLLEPEAYTSQLLSWLEASPSYRMGLVDAAVDQFGWSGLFDALQAGQLLEKEEVLQIVREFLEKRIEEGEED